MAHLIRNSKAELGATAQLVLCLQIKVERLPNLLQNIQSHFLVYAPANMERYHPHHRLPKLSKRRRR